jgi:hypothetical protein
MSKPKAEKKPRAKKEKAPKKTVAPKLPGMADPKNDEIEDAAELELECNSKAGKAREKAKEAQDNLLAVMLKHDCKTYRYRDRTARVKEGRTKVVVEIESEETNNEVDNEINPGGPISDEQAAEVDEVTEA